MEILFVIVGIIFALIVAYMVGHWIGYEKGAVDQLELTQALQDMRRETYARKQQA